MRQYVFGSWSVWQDVYFQHQDATVAERSSGDHRSAIQETEYLFGNHFPRADRFVDAQLADNVGVVGAAHQCHDRRGTNILRLDGGHDVVLVVARTSHEHIGATNTLLFQSRSAYTC